MDEDCLYLKPKRMDTGRRRSVFRHRLAGSDGGIATEHLRSVRCVSGDWSLLRYLSRVPGVAPGPDRGAAHGVMGPYGGARLNGWQENPQGIGVL
jgi:hypothetical protein